ncbi:MAG: anthranilate synthase component 1 [Gammaproteobacteria bacterium]|nr:anthranilate synthase component 1 [Gammaproteobacteria bacterium]
MTDTLMDLVAGEAELIRRPAAYTADPLALYERLSELGKVKNSLLLESAEVTSKAKLKSLLLLRAALRIVGDGRSVTIEALTSNGQALLEPLASRFEALAVTTLDGARLILDFAAAPAELDEDSRLKAVGPLDALRLLQQQLRARDADEDALFLGGVFAYDLIATFETLPEVPASANHCPDFVFYLAESWAVIDHQAQTAELLGAVFGGHNSGARFYEMTRRLEQLARQISQPQPPLKREQDASAASAAVSACTNDADFCSKVERLKHHIVIGDIFQVVPSRSFSLPCPDPLLAYRQLKLSNPSPYMFFMNDERFSLFGASPESAIKFDAGNRQVEIYPIAGTRRRGFAPDGSIDADLDGRLELEMRLDRKELAEHIMLVDLARNDVARISEPGSRYVADLLKVDRYSHVMHLVSRVVGTLRSDLDALHAYQACMNMGTLVGAPKIRASQLIRDIEGKRRGSYGGAVGYLNGKGDMDTCIVIRSAFVRDGVATVQAGAGVVYDSVPQAEADETRNKAQAVLSAIAAANRQLAEV